VDILRALMQSKFPVPHGDGVTTPTLSPKTNDVS
jgi:hypothetical protein